MKPSAPISRQNGRFGDCAARTKQDVSQQISHRIGQDSVTAWAVIDSFFETVKHSLTPGEAIHMGFWLLSSAKPPTWRATFPNLAITVPDHTLPIVKPATEFAQPVGSRPTTNPKRKV